MAESKCEYKVLRATELWQQAGAYSVRIQGMGRQPVIEGPTFRCVTMKKKLNR